MPQENLITQILREKREGEAKARIESVGIKSTDVWMLGDKTYEEAKKHALSNPNFADVTFLGDNVLRGDNIIGYLRHDGGVYYFNPVDGDLPYIEGTPNPWKIAHYSFGKITVDGEQYTHDVILGWDKAQPIKKWTRKEWHFVYPDDLKDVVVLDPHIVVFGTGASGMLRVGKEAEEMLLERYVGVRKERSDIAVKTFNKLIEEGKHAVLAIHVTC